MDACKLIDAGKLADLLGLARRTIYKPDWQRRARLIPIRIGGSLRFRYGDVERLLRTRDQPAVGEIGDLRGWAAANRIPWPDVEI